MTASSATLTDSSAAPAGPQVQPGASAWQRPLGWALMLGAAAAVWPGGWTALLGLLMAAVGVHLALKPAARQASTVEVPTVGGRVGAEVMVSEVVPVWSRQMEVTRDAATEGLSNILQVFTQMSDALYTLTQNLATFEISAAPGAVHEAVGREAQALTTLTAASQRAFDQRDAAVAELSRCGDALGELQQLAKQVREIARHTRLVAFNASIEANRSRGGSSGEGGSQAVAVELRTLATRMGETGDRVERVVLALQSSIRKARQTGEVQDTTPEELRLEIDIHARDALRVLLGTMGAALQGSHSVQEASVTLREQLEAVFIHFQFGDRVSQMMSIVANDMSNFARWVAEHPRATQSDAAEWLTALEASYTMDEQRSSHHGNVHVEQSTGVEFF
jgi:methyl-accepting chemotaxis protein